MALGIEQKKVIVTEVAEVANCALSAVAADYNGLKVAEMDALRTQARNSGVYLRVVRNTLARRALEGTAFECMSEGLTGPLVLAFSKEEPGAAARLIRDFSKKHEALETRIVSIGGQAHGPDRLEAVAKLPTYDEAISKLMSAMLAPVTKLARTIREPHAKLVRTLAAVKDSMGE